jgi:hypothetical protein
MSVLYFDMRTTWRRDGVQSIAVIWVCRWDVIGGLKNRRPKAVIHARRSERQEGAQCATMLS